MLPRGGRGGYSFDGRVMEVKDCRLHSVLTCLQCFALCFNMSGMSATAADHKQNCADTASAHRRFDCAKRRYSGDTQCRGAACWAAADGVSPGAAVSQGMKSTAGLATASTDPPDIASSCASSCLSRSASSWAGIASDRCDPAAASISAEIACDRCRPASARS